MGAMDITSWYYRLADLGLSRLWILSAGTWDWDTLYLYPIDDLSYTTHEITLLMDEAEMEGLKKKRKNRLQSGRY
jgi:hypothetical protein